LKKKYPDKILIFEISIWQPCSRTWKE